MIDLIFQISRLFYPLVHLLLKKILIIFIVMLKLMCNFLPSPEGQISSPVLHWEIPFSLYIVENFNAGDWVWQWTLLMKMGIHFSTVKGNWCVKKHFHPCPFISGTILTDKNIMMPILMFIRASGAMETILL